MARPTKEETQRRDTAKKRVEELFGNIVKVDVKNVTKVVDKIDELQSGGDNSWLSDQVTVLSDKNKELEDEMLQVREDYNKLLDSKGGEVPSSGSDSELKKGVKAIFDDLRSNYEGTNTTKTKYEDAKIHVLLDKFLGTFPFLLDGRK